MSEVFINMAGHSGGTSPSHQAAERGGSEVQARVRRIQPGESLGEVQCLRREVYFQEQGLRRYDNQRIADGLDTSGTILVMENQHQAVGTIRMHSFATAPVQVEYGQLFEIDTFARAWDLRQIGMGTRLAVQSEQRVKSVMDTLIEACYCYALEQDMRFALLACDPNLHGLFEHYGFQEYLPPRILSDGRAVLRMILVVDDEAHLRSCNSPLLRLIRDPNEGMIARQWLQRTYVM